jgi:hypothetical protein
MLITQNIKSNLRGVNHDGGESLLQELLAISQQLPYRKEEETVETNFVVWGWVLLQENGEMELHRHAEHKQILLTNF